MRRREDAGEARIPGGIRGYIPNCVCRMYHYIRLHMRLCACICVCFLSSLAFFQEGIRSAQALRTAEGTLSLICGEGITVAGAREFLQEDFQKNPAESGEAGGAGEDSEAGQEEALYPVFWTERKDQRIANKELERACPVNVIYAAGNAELLCREGNLLSPGDTSGCLVDDETAKKLFGYGDPSGSTIVYEGREYEIRGVIRDRKEVLMIQVSQDTADDALQLDRITVHTGERRPDVLSETVKNRYGIAGNRMEWNLLFVIAWAILLMFPLAAAITFLGRVSETMRKAESRGEKIFWKLCFCAMLLCIGVCAVRQIRIPQEIIPSTWSDFDFWASLWDEKKEALRLLVEAEKSGIEEQYFEAFFRSAACGGMALVSYLLGYGLFLKNKNNPGSF